MALPRTAAPSSSSVHHSLSSSLSKGFLKVGGVILGQIVPDERLATVLVYSLEDLKVPMLAAATAPSNSHAPCSRQHIRDQGRERRICGRPAHQRIP